MKTVRKSRSLKRSRIRKNTSQEAIVTMSRDDDPNVRMIVARSKYTPDNVLFDLVRWGEWMEAEVALAQIVTRARSRELEPISLVPLPMEFSLDEKIWDIENELAKIGVGVLYTLIEPENQSDIALADDHRVAIEWTHTHKQRDSVKENKPCHLGLVWDPESQKH